MLTFGLSLFMLSITFSLTLSSTSVYFLYTFKLDIRAFPSLTHASRTRCPSIIYLLKSVCPTIHLFAFFFDIRLIFP